MQTAEALSKQYDIVITNPPYMGASLMPNGLKDFIGRQYGDYKSDIFAAFIVRCIEFCKDNGQLGLITPYVWMFLTAHEKLRAYINRKANISSLIQLEYNAFEAACVPVATFTLQKRGNHSSGEYIKLSDFRVFSGMLGKALLRHGIVACRFVALGNGFQVQYVIDAEKLFGLEGGPGE